VLSPLTGKADLLEVAPHLCLWLQLSMDVVEVHPDGSLRVEALAAHRHPHAKRFTTKVARDSEH
jgi:hypothetical protein